MVEWLERPGYGAEIARKIVNLKPGLAILRLENFLCHPNCKWVPVSNQEKNRAAKGERWTPPFICCVQDKVGI